MEQSSVDEDRMVDCNEQSSKSEPEAHDTVTSEQSTVDEPKLKKKKHKKHKSKSKKRKKHKSKHKSKHRTESA